MYYSFGNNYYKELSNCQAFQTDDPISVEKPSLFSEKMYLEVAPILNWINSTVLYYH